MENNAHPDVIKYLIANKIDLDQSNSDAGGGFKEFGSYRAVSREDGE